MLEIIKTDLSKNSTHLKPVVELPFYQKMVKTHDKEIFLVFEARLDNHVVGAIFGYAFTAIKSSTIEGLHVLPEYRHQGIGAKLFDAYVDELKAHDVHIVKMFDLETPFLNKRFPHKSGPVLKRYTFDAPTFHPEWFERKIPLGKGFQVFPWSKVTAYDKVVITRWLASGKITEDVNPLENESIIEPINSLGLRYNGELVGWLVTHRIAPDTISYKAFYIVHELRFRTASTQMLAKSIRRQQASPVRWSKMDINQEAADSSWLKFVEKRLAPYSLKQEDIFLYTLPLL